MKIIKEVQGKWLFVLHVILNQPPNDAQMIDSLMLCKCLCNFIINNDFFCSVVCGSLNWLSVGLSADVTHFCSCIGLNA